MRYGYIGDYQESKLDENDKLDEEYYNLVEEQNEIMESERITKKDMERIKEINRQQKEIIDKIRNIF